MSARTLVVTHRSRTATHELRVGKDCVIGRARDCDVFLDDHQVSRRHAILRLERTGVTIEDLGSQNGTLLLESSADLPSETVTQRRMTTRLPASTRTMLAADAMLQVGTALLTLHDPARRVRPGSHAGAAGMIVVDPAMHRLLELADRVASTDLSVLLLGESGAGKDVLARYIHQNSMRGVHRLVSLNCGALPETLIESELFGHEKGAFTGAAAAKPGQFEAADRGTLFLDEVGELTPSLQVKLLRVLEDRMVQRVGALEPRAVDVRFVAATNRDLERAIADGKFREDLFYRLNGITLYVPPLRERRADIVPLAAQFLAAFGKSLGRPVPALSDEARVALETYDWPGNVRELKNVIERAAVICTGTEIHSADLALSSRGRRPPPTGDAPPAAAVSAAAPDQEAEREQIIAALETCAGNQTRAAEMLGITRRMLTRRLAKFQIPRPRDRRE